jgi:hypothetical protein
MIPATCNVIIAPNIQALIFNWICLRGYWRYVDNSMLLILQTWCQIQLTTARLRYVNCCPGHIQCNYSSAYSGFNIQLNVSALLLVTRRHFDAHCTANWVPNIAHVLQFTLCELWSRTCNNVVTSPHIKASVCNWKYLLCYWRYLDNSMRAILQTWCQIQRTSSGLRYVNYGPGHIQCIYNSIYSEFNIHLNVSALLLYISRQFNARYTANLVPNTAHIQQLSLCERWSRTHTKYLQLRIFMLQYSAVGICAAIVDITTILYALHCKLWAKYSAYTPVYTMWTVVPAMYKVLRVPHI